MTRGLLTSFIGHALLLAYALLNLPQEPLDLLSRKTAGRAGVTRAFVVGEHELRALR